MGSVSEAIARYRKELEPYAAQLVAVSKTKPQELILEAYDHGQRDFGENKVQDLVQKYEALPKDIRWHMVGHLQTNKVKYIAPFVHMIHSVDSWKLLKEINKQGARFDRTIQVLLQGHIAREETKFGLDKAEILSLVGSSELGRLPNVRIAGLMGMATNTDDEEVVASEFAGLKATFDELKASHELSTLSMGMTNDYRIALRNGATMIRIGSDIFGERY